MTLGENSRKIFEFKGLICKIFRNKELEVPGFRISRFQGHNLATARFAPKEKGYGKNPHPFPIHNSIITSSTYPPRQVLQLYFARLFIDLRVKRSKRGVDNRIIRREKWNWLRRLPFLPRRARQGWRSPHPQNLMQSAISLRAQSWS